MSQSSAMVDKRIVVVIPAYKAAATLPLVLARIPPHVYKAIYRIVVVEDSDSQTPRSATPDLQIQHPKMEVIIRDYPGYGAAQKKGFRRALELEADIAVLLHADGQYAPEIMEELYRPLLRGDADIVLGSRMKNYRSALRGGMPLYKLVANICLTHIENFVYGLNLSEYHSGYMLYSRKALETIPFEKLSNAFHYDGEMLLVGGRKKLRIADLPIPTHYGKETSYATPIPYGFEVLGVILKYFRGKYDYKNGHDPR
jgi:glycosyltransferase involved in cell wall biosynthesis